MADANPSFDCANAQTSVEKSICFSDDLQWFDRALARLHELTKKNAVGAQRDELVTSQRAFLARRESCGGQPYHCLWNAYIERLRQLADRTGIYEAFAEYAPPKDYSGTLFVARYEFTASIRLGLSKNQSQNMCTFEADDASKGGKGVIRWHAPPGDEYARGCRFILIPEGDDVRVDAKSCQMFCGHNVWLDGLYTRKR
jgi:uncharacterized protein